MLSMSVNPLSGLPSAGSTVILIIVNIFVILGQFDHFGISALDLQHVRNVQHVEHCKHVKHVPSGPVGGRLTFLTCRSFSHFLKFLSFWTYRHWTCNVLKMYKMLNVFNMSVDSLRRPGKRSTDMLSPKCSMCQTCSKCWSVKHVNACVKSVTSWNVSRPPAGHPESLDCHFNHFEQFWHFDCFKHFAGPMPECRNVQNVRNVQHVQDVTANGSRLPLLLNKTTFWTFGAFRHWTCKMFDMFECAKCATYQNVKRLPSAALQGVDWHI